MGAKKELQSHIPVLLYMGKKQNVKLLREKLTADYHVLFFNGKKTEKTIIASGSKAFAMFHKIEKEIREREQ